MKKLLKGIVIICTWGLLTGNLIQMQEAEQAKAYDNKKYTTTTQYTTSNSTNKTNGTTTSTTTNKSTTVTTTTTTKPVATPKPVDSRVADYKATNPDYQPVKYTWTTRDGREAYITLYIDVNAYKYYRSLDRYYSVDEYNNYFNDKVSREYVKELVKCFKDIQKQGGYSDYDTVCEVINFVQSAITYEYDVNGTGQQDFPKYPIETLWNKKGDCEDSSILLGAIFREMGYGSILMHFEGHVAVGVLGNSQTTGTYLTVDGGKYFYVETTAKGWAIGQLPDSMSKDEYLGYVMVK